MRKKLLFTGGGTTGHVTKNLIVMEALRIKNDQFEFHYMGSKKGKEAELVKNDLATMHFVSSGKLRRYFSLETIPDFFRFIWGFWQALVRLGQIKPTLVFSSGGYVALPVTWAAYLRKIPVITHETDSYPGLANRMIAKVAAKVLLGFATAEQYLDSSKVVYTGNPVSPSLFAGSKEKALRKLGFSDNKKIILFMGGSQGAQQINDLVAEILPELLEKYQVIHLTGKGKTRRDEACLVSTGFSSYRSFEYVTKDYADFLNAADLIVCRGGGNSLTEVAALGKKALVIPLLSAAGDHQRKNALEMAEKEDNWAVLDDKDLNAGSLLKAINRLILKETNPSMDRNNSKGNRLESPIKLIIDEILLFCN